MVFPHTRPQDVNPWAFTVITSSSCTTSEDIINFFRNIAAVGRGDGTRPARERVLPAVSGRKGEGERQRRPQEDVPRRQNADASPSMIFCCVFAVPWIFRSAVHYEGRFQFSGGGVKH
ncbi:hypothetical protein OPV22_014796 [Ensete ventricosum]|uniref:Uncharacterized protein n=1 Tax=Ensete ventricosum TaxID=4639 RepID=A0AAV8RBH3_ENSVE|nr:hypothetical protein OPV22_014796 [Ensete ventricosum]